MRKHAKERWRQKIENRISNIKKWLFRIKGGKKKIIRHTIAERFMCEPKRKREPLLKCCCLIFFLFVISMCLIWYLCVLFQFFFIHFLSRYDNLSGRGVSCLRCKLNIWKLIQKAIQRIRSCYGYMNATLHVPYTKGFLTKSTDSKMCNFWSKVWIQFSPKTEFKYLETLI